MSDKDEIKKEIKKEISKRVQLNDSKEMFLKCPQHGTIFPAGSKCPHCP